MDLSDPRLRSSAPARAEVGADSTEPPAPPSTVSSDALLGRQSQIAIRHNQTTYFLRKTRFGKLILTK